MMLLKLIVYGILFSKAWSTRLATLVFDAQQCQHGLYSNTDPYPLFGLVDDSKHTGNCLIEGGIRPGGKLASTGTVNDLSRQFGSTGFGIELWLQPLQALTVSAPIVSIGQDKGSYYPCANNLVVRWRAMSSEQKLISEH